MNPLQRALIEKTGHDFGFEYVYSSSDSEITLASALHPVRAKVFMIENDYLVEIVQGSPLINLEMARSFTASLDNIFQCHDIDQLAHLLKRMASLGKSLPNQAEHDFDAAVKKELELLPAGVRGTEIERMVRQRIGQQTYRKAMLEYWGGACAITGIEIVEVLRASHAKPWAKCDNDAERLDVFNGFLLSANLDALFDRFLISFTGKGKILISQNISPENQKRLGLDKEMSLRWLAPEHLVYLKYHNNLFYEK